MANNGGEPSSAPQPERWYELKLGSSLKDGASSKFCTLRYEFKPASIDKQQAGTLHKTKDNRVTVEFNNNQLGKPKVTFEGTSEDYKDIDGVLFFDGESFRLERLHRAVKRLRHVRLPGESAVASNTGFSTSNAPAMESRSPSLGKAMKSQALNKPANHAIPLEVERIDIGDQEISGSKPSKRNSENCSALPNPYSTPPEAKAFELDVNLDDILADDEGSSPKVLHIGGFDMNLPSQNDTDDEIADVDVSGDECNKGPNAAEALRAQVNAAEEGQQQDLEHDDSSSTSGSSGSGTSGSSGSGSGSGSSSSDSDDSEGDSASSGGDVDI